MNLICEHNQVLDELNKKMHILYKLSANTRIVVLY